MSNGTSVPFPDGCFPFPSHGCSSSPRFSHALTHLFFAAELHESEPLVVGWIATQAHFHDTSNVVEKRGHQRFVHGAWDVSHVHRASAHRPDCPGRRRMPHPPLGPYEEVSPLPAPLFARKTEAVDVASDDGACVGPKPTVQWGHWLHRWMESTPSESVFCMHVEEERPDQTCTNKTASEGEVVEDSMRFIRRIAPAMGFPEDEETKEHDLPVWRRNWAIFCKGKATSLTPKETNCAVYPAPSWAGKCSRFELRWRGRTTNSARGTSSVQV